ncbi:MAG: 2-oxoacid:acceptor oxidoreductase subunit alpha [Robiginitomaculum sp.]
MGALINDFVVKVGTVNGTGSASANGLLMKAIFRMGIPVVGKNIFPSNIQGLPTWYEIRVTEAGYSGRSGDVHLMVAMNAKSHAKDLACVTPGGFLLYDNTWPVDSLQSRDDVTTLGIPLAKMCNAEFAVARSRILMKNMAYVGAVAAMINLDMEVVHALVSEMFAKKPKLIPLNIKALALGYDYAKENFPCAKALKLESRDLTKGKVMMEGNRATGLGCVYGGATFGAWYPITPSTSVMDSFAQYCAQFRVDAETGKNKYCIIQAEDELASAGLMIGASWNGARAFTPTSGAGISLMSEFIGFAYYTETPAVFIDVMRVGPSTGMPTRTQQCDITLTAYASHGDTKHIVLYPANPSECFDMAVNALDLAERFQTPVFLLSDLDVGMNDWMIDELSWDDNYLPDRGKILTAEDLDAMEQPYYRYEDVDGDHIPYRTLPATHPSKGVYFNRGSGHTKFGQYTEDGAAYQEVVDRLAAKWASAAPKIPAPIIHAAKSVADYAIIAIGSSDGAIIEARDRLADTGLNIDYMRVRGFPFADAVSAFIKAHKKTFVIEQNRDGQLHNLLLTETDAPREKLGSILHYNGDPLSFKFVQAALIKAIGELS